jgi:hypothetical protein
LNSITDRPPILAFLLTFAVLLAVATGLAALSDAVDPSSASRARVGHDEHPELDRRSTRGQTTVAATLGPAGARASLANRAPEHDSSTIRQ